LDLTKASAGVFAAKDAAVRTTTRKRRKREKLLQRLGNPAFVRIAAENLIRSGDGAAIAVSAAMNAGLSGGGNITKQTREKRRCAYVCIAVGSLSAKKDAPGNTATADATCGQPQVHAAK